MLFDEEVVFTYIGYAAGLATILTFTIQILKIIETKNVTSLSSYMYIIYSLGLVCWAAYGIFIENWLLVFSNLITFFCTFAILILIIYYDAEDKIERTRRDELTSAFNLKYFEQTIPVRITEAKINNQNFAIIITSIADFTNTTKKYGQKTAKKLLKTLAKILEKDLRETDMVARVDNNKFAVYLSGADNKTAEIVAKRLFKNATTTTIKVAKEQEINLDIKMGICSSQKGDTMEELMQKADKALKGITSKTSAKIKIFEK